jgi:hypothetical protein
MGCRRFPRGVGPYAGSHFPSSFAIIEIPLQLAHLDITESPLSFHRNGRHEKADTGEEGRSGGEEGRQRGGEEDS